MRIIIKIKTILWLLNRVGDQFTTIKMIGVEKEPNLLTNFIQIIWRDEMSSLNK